MREGLRWRIATAVYAVAVLAVSVIPVDPRLAPGHLDKALHLCEYLLLAWLLVKALRTSTPRRIFLTAWGWATAYGAAIELLQAAIPWRSADLMDAALNAIGAALGVWISTVK
ncbi:MAG: VanZ family protein [Candidatus Omnitrophica bacterium]|nr:VanZ family protein [Candidatus Omnitrophota bacterium]